MTWPPFPGKLNNYPSEPTPSPGLKKKLHIYTPFKKGGI